MLPNAWFPDEYGWWFLSRPFAPICNFLLFHCKTPRQNGENNVFFHSFQRVLPLISTCCLSFCQLFSPQSQRPASHILWKSGAKWGQNSWKSHEIDGFLVWIYWIICPFFINLPHRCHTAGRSSGLLWGEATVYGDWCPIDWGALSDLWAIAGRCCCLPLLLWLTHILNNFSTSHISCAPVGAQASKLGVPFTISPFAIYLSFR